MSHAFTHTRYCDELSLQAGLFREALTAAGTAEATGSAEATGTAEATEATGIEARVPSCPDWTLRELTVHLGGAYRWFAEIVRTRATAMVPDDAVPGFLGPGDGASVEALDAWFAESAQLAVEQLRSAGPDVRVWSWSTEQNPGFWARRAVHETVIHRADACLAARIPFSVAPEVAADCLEEWLEILASPVVQEHKEEIKRLREHAGKSLHLHATDVDADTGTDTDTDTGTGTDTGLRAEWLIELGADGFTWRRKHGKATTALRGPLADVLLTIYRRLPAGSDRVEVLGDPTLLDEWLKWTSFE